MKKIIIAVLLALTFSFDALPAYRLGPTLEEAGTGTLERPKPRGKKPGIKKLETKCKKSDAGVEHKENDEHKENVTRDIRFDAWTRSQKYVQQIEQQRQQERDQAVRQVLETLDRSRQISAQN